MKINVQELALQAGFEQYEPYHLSGNGESDCICSVGEYPCGDIVRALVCLVLEEAITAATNESLSDDTNDPQDVAYNIAIEHAVAAIRKLKP